MTSVAVEITKGVLAALEAYPPIANNAAVTADRLYAANIPLRDLKGTRVLCAPTEVQTEVLTRTAHLRTYAVVVGVYRHVRANDVEGADDVIAFAEGIAEHLTNNSLGGLSAVPVSYVGIAHDPIYDPDQIEAGVLASFIQITYKRKG